MGIIVGINIIVIIGIIKNAVFIIYAVAWLLHSNDIPDIAIEQISDANTWIAMKQPIELPTEIEILISENGWILWSGADIPCIPYLFSIFTT